MITLKKTIALIKHLICGAYCGNLIISFKGGKIISLEEYRKFKSDEEFDLS